MEKVEERWEEIMCFALGQQASDIHLTQKEENFTLEMRIDGKMKALATKGGDQRLLSYLQFMANLDVGNSRLPQTGQFEMTVDKQLLSLRFAYFSHTHYRNGVVRILNHHLVLSGRSLSRIRKQNELLWWAIHQRNGLILMTGSTGSGKTSSLYALLNELRYRKIYTLEDPIERYYENLMQWQINEAQHFDYQEGIKQVLRHDPDVLMIGEIRDKKAAKGALQAAETGHLVFSSLHASSLPAALERMQEFGISLASLLANLRLLCRQDLHIIEKKKVALFEMVCQKDLIYYQKYHRYPPSFLSLKAQEEALRKKGLWHEEMV